MTDVFTHDLHHASLPRTLRCVTGALALLCSFGLFSACSSDDDPATSKSAIASGCTINSDCASPLVCAFQRCHTACEASRDCPAGQRCMASDRPFHVCQLPEEERCTYNSNCPVGQVCGVDNKCRDQCSSARDCVSGQTCTRNTCAEPEELHDGGLPSPDAGADDAAAGLPCSYNSECPEPLVCRGNLCLYECLADADCPEGKSCTSEHRCRSLGADGCALTSCAAQGKTCGSIDDGCGGTIECGKCPKGETCGGEGRPNVCGKGECKPATCEDRGATCGALSDGCAKTLDCGKCASGQVCGGGGTPNVCACKPATCDEQGKNCGVIPDGCGGLLSCGSCPSPAVCGGDGVANVCATVSAPASCRGAGAAVRNTCGSGTDDCCKSNDVPGGTFNLNNDASLPASMSPYRLDRYTVTVGGVRAFMQAGLGTQVAPPAAGSGAMATHAQSGWDPTWNALLPTDAAALRQELGSCGATSSWSDVPGQRENLPINCVSWYLAVAFCGWDGAHLATEAELSFAQSGGEQQRYYPWSVPSDSQTVDGTYMNSWNSGNGQVPTPVGAKSPKGDGRWGHSDLVGNVGQWTLDLWADKPTFSGCHDCVALGSGTTRVVRGGSFYQYASKGTSASRTDFAADTGSNEVGFRCAR